MFTKLVRIGKDAEMKYLPSGTAILEMTVVYDIGFGDKKAGQWVKLSMFGQRAEKLVQHFTKGKQIVATMDDVQSRAWIKDGEAKSAMQAKLVEFEFAGGQTQNGAQQQQAQPQRAQQAAPQQSWGNEPPQQAAPQQNAPASKPPAQYAEPSMDFDDDIPFMNPYFREAILAV